MRLPFSEPIYTVRRSGPPNVTLAIHGARPRPVANSTSSVTLVAEEGLFERVDLRRIPFVQQHAQVAFGRQHEQLVRVDERAPEVAVAVEGDPVGPGALAEGRGAEDLAIA